MMPFRRVTFQLAPLLDLLLIVMFSQYLEVQIAAEREAGRMAAETQSATADLEALRGQLANVQRQLAQWEQQQRQADREEHQSKEQLGQLLGELFRVPEETLQKIADSHRDAATLSPAERETLRKEFRRLANARGDEVVDHMLTFLEMKKRFDVWELYLHENGTIVVAAGPHRKSVQTGIVTTPKQFSDELFKLYKSFPQTKSIVLILVSYGDTRLAHRLAVLQGLPIATERMRADSGTARFEYAVLGYRPNAKP